jgi:Hemerythrin HHE cation binding domain
MHFLHTDAPSGATVSRALAQRDTTWMTYPDPVQSESRTTRGTTLFPAGETRAIIPSMATPKTASQVRAEILGEHFQLRRLIEETRGLLGRSDSSDALRTCTERLADALFSHSRHEEHALHGILAPIHARTPSRFAIMDEAHIAEHARFATVLRGLRTTDDASRRAALAEATNELETHMTEEEQVLLGEDVPGDHH